MISGLPVPPLVSYNGYPDIKWFWDITDSSANLKNLQTDFVWAMPLLARPQKKP